MCVKQSQNVPLSCLSRPLADRLAEAAYRDILGLSYARAFPQLGVLPAVLWSIANFEKKILGPVPPQAHWAQVQSRQGRVQILVKV